MSGSKVYVNVYDMCSLNKYTAYLGIGVYHAGIQVHSTEYGYGGHPFNFSGVFEIDPCDEEALGEENFKYRETIELGSTAFSDDDVREMVKSMGNNYKGVKYHLLHNNCNHFCDALAKILTGKGIPPWINRLAYVSTCVPFLEPCLPKEFLTPAAINDSMRAQNFLNHMASGNSIGLSSSQGHGRQNLDDASVLN